jgi:hypothetical protein
MNRFISRLFRKEKEETRMSDNQKKVLEMLADKKISVDEAYRLLSALRTEPGVPESTEGVEAKAKPKAKYLHVSVAPGPHHVHDEDAELVNVRVPMSLIRSGMKLSSLLPGEAGEKVTEALGEKGINFDMRNMKPEDIEELIAALGDLEVNVTNEKEVVRVFVE